ncbi:hypothetical protein [Zoogloea sp.]|jgi:hypothetical protein|uniref:hypothetical protein n=1 Tax=Zoogloea sp. TaxID=49181 RepID=UPI0032205E55
MNTPVSAASYLARSQELRKSGDKASLFYSALELRCGIEARLKEHVAVADGVSKRQINEWKIRNLGRTIEGSFGLGDSMLLVFLTMSDGRVCQFMYAPVTARLQEIGEKCGDYLHAIHPDRLAKSGFWDEFRSLVTEGCHLLELACSSEILKPTVHSGLHFCLPPDDQRMGIVQDLIGGAPGQFSTATITPTGPLTFYPSDDTKPFTAAEGFAAR